MPYSILMRGEKHCVVQTADGSEVGCHDTHEEALAHQRALMANIQETDSAAFRIIQRGDRYYVVNATDGSDPGCNGHATHADTLAHQHELMSTSSSGTGALAERDFTPEKRDALAKSGHALPDGSYPIETVADLHNAIQSYGRASDPAAVKRHIIKRARALGVLDQLPADWRVSESADAEPVAPAVLREGIQILEAVAGTKGREWEIQIIQPGLSLNGVEYSAEVLKRAAHLYEGVWSYADHTADGARGARSVRDKVGRIHDVSYGQRDIGGRVREGLFGRFRVVAPWLRETLLEAVEAGELDFIGFSHDVVADWRPAQRGNRRVKEVTDIQKVNSVDVVDQPSAGGRVSRLVAGVTADGKEITVDELNEIKEQVAALTAAVGQLREAVTKPPPEPDKQTEQKPPEAPDNTGASAIQDVVARAERLLQEATKRDATARITEALTASRLSELGREQIRKRMLECLDRRAVEDTELQAAIKEQTDYEAAVAQQHSNPRGVGNGRLVAGDAGADQQYNALVGWFMGEKYKDVAPFRTLKEAYCRMTGSDPFDTSPYEIMRSFGGSYDSAYDHKRVQESLTTSLWNQVYADVFYFMLMKAYTDAPYNDWRSIVSDIEAVPDFRTRHWARVGGYGNLATVAESANYPTLTSPTDEEVTYSVSKYGGIDDVTFESIVGDRGGAIRRIPVAMGRAAKRTLYRFVLNLVTTDNPNMDYDSAAMYGTGATRLNKGTTAISLAGLKTTIQAMRDQTAYNESTEILGPRNVPKWLIVPNELEFVAKRLVSPITGGYVISPTADTGGEVDPTAFTGMGIGVIVYDVLTDANDYFAVANPAEVPTVVMGFLNGQQEPDLVVQDQPQTGAVFTADKISYRVRHIFGGDVLDHRSFYWQNVA